SSMRRPRRSWNTVTTAVLPNQNSGARPLFRPNLNIPTPNDPVAPRPDVDARVADSGVSHGQRDVAGRHAGAAVRGHSFGRRFAEQGFEAPPQFVPRPEVTVIGEMLLV